MTAPSTLVFFHNPQSRASMVRALLEELDVAFELCPVDFRRNEQLSDDYLAINPMGKVPAIRHNGTLVTETVAIYIHLADFYGQAGLAPALDDAARGSYLRWLVFYAACFEPAICDKAMKRGAGPRAQSPYADYDTTLAAITRQIASGEWLLGDRFSAADVLWGNALGFATAFNLVAKTPLLTGYIDKVLSRPAQKRALAADEALAASMGLAA